MFRDPYYHNRDIAFVAGFIWALFVGTFIVLGTGADHYSWIVGVAIFGLLLLVDFLLWVSPRG